MAKKVILRGKDITNIVSRVYFKENELIEIEQSLLTGRKPTSDVIVEYSSGECETVTSDVIEVTLLNGITYTVQPHSNKKPA